MKSEKFRFETSGNTIFKPALAAAGISVKVA